MFYKIIHQFARQVVCNCPYGTPDTGCALPTDINCTGCSPNYKLSTSLEKCREYYGDWGLTVSSPVKCCLPDECNVSDFDGLDELNIEKKVILIIVKLNRVIHLYTIV